MVPRESMAGESLLYLRSILFLHVVVTAPRAQQLNEQRRR